MHLQKCIYYSTTSLSFAGLRLPVYKAMACKAPVLPPAPLTMAEAKFSDIDVSDLGSRNYGARSDFYCLVTEDLWAGRVISLFSLFCLSVKIATYLEITVSIALFVASGEMFVVFAVCW